LTAAAAKRVPVECLPKGTARTTSLKITGCDSFSVATTWVLLLRFCAAAEKETTVNSVKKACGFRVYAPRKKKFRRFFVPGVCVCVCLLHGMGGKGCSWCAEEVAYKTAKLSHTL
jgi:hypothetical protein